MHWVPDLQQWQLISACKLSVFNSKLVKYMANSVYCSFAVAITLFCWTTFSLCTAQKFKRFLFIPFRIHTTLTLLSTSKMFCFYFFSVVVVNVVTTLSVRLYLIFVLSIFILVAWVSVVAFKIFAEITIHDSILCESKYCVFKLQWQMEKREKGLTFFYTQTFSQCYCSVV